MTRFLPLPRSSVPTQRPRWRRGIVVPALVMSAVTKVAAAQATVPDTQMTPPGPAWVLLLGSAVGGMLVGAALLGFLARRRWLRLARERDAAIARADSAAADTTAALRAKDEFVATLSHELRTPLQSILGWSQLLKRQVDDKTVLSAESMLTPVTTVERNVRSLATVIDDLLDVSQAVTGQASLALDRVNLVEPLRDAVGTVQAAATARRVELLLELDSTSLWMVGDRGRLQQILFNLIDNAVKFTPGDGTVHVSAARVGTVIEVRVRDTGIGIAPEMLDRIFDRYVQCSVSTHRRYGGLGIGLALVRHFVELHGGRVEAYSDGQGRGAEFVLQFTSTVLEAPMPTPSPKPVAVSASAANNFNRRLSGLKLLVVDDDTDVRMVLDSLLSDEGAEVVTAASAEEGFEQLRRQRMDLILSDIGMPNTDGYVLARAVRGFGNAFSATPTNTPMIALTAFSRVEDERRAIDSGFNAHLGKPVDVNRLIDVLCDHAHRSAEVQRAHPNVRRINHPA